MYLEENLMKISDVFQFYEFWIYSVYGKFYLKLVRGASLRVRPKNPPIFLSVYPPNLRAQKIRAILPTASQSCAVLWRSSISFIYLCMYSSWSSSAAGMCSPWRSIPPPLPGAPARPAWNSWPSPEPTGG